MLHTIMFHHNAKQMEEEEEQPMQDTLKGRGGSTIIKPKKDFYHRYRMTRPWFKLVKKNSFSFSFLFSLSLILSDSLFHSFFSYKQQSHLSFLSTYCRENNTKQPMFLLQFANPNLSLRLLQTAQSKSPLPQQMASLLLPQLPNPEAMKFIAFIANHRVEGKLPLCLLVQAITRLQTAAGTRVRAQARWPPSSDTYKRQIQCSSWRPKQA